MISLLANMVSAAEQIGTGLVNGNLIQIFADGTWKYSDPKNELLKGCNEVTKVVAFCPTPKSWIKVKPPTADINAMFRVGSRQYLMFVVEDVGTLDGMSVDFLSETVIETLASETDVDPNSIPVEYLGNVGLMGHSARQLSLFTKVEGLNVYFIYSLLVTDTLSVQVVTFEIGKTLTESHKEHHAKVLKNVRKVSDG